MPQISTVTLLDDENPVPTLLVRDRIVVDANRSAREVFGADPALHGDVGRLFPAQCRDKLYQALCSAVPVACELQLGQPNADSLPIRFLLVPTAEGCLMLGATPGFAYSNDHGRRLFEVNTAAANQAREMSRRSFELQTATDHLRRLGALRDRFIATLSHDLKSPLSAARLQAGALQKTEEPLAPAVLHARARTIERNTDRMLELIGMVLDAAQLESGTLELKRLPVDLVSIALDAAEMLEPIASRAGVALRVSGARSAPVVGDRVRLLEVLANLVENAIRHSPTGGSVRVQIEEGPAEVRCDVSDEGTGVPAELRRFVFEPYEQSGKQGGSIGLGLFIVRQLVELHGGKVWLEEAPQPGARFAFTLPKTRYGV